MRARMCYGRNELDEELRCQRAAAIDFAAAERSSGVNFAARAFPAPDRIFWSSFSAASRRTAAARRMAAKRKRPCCAARKANRAKSFVTDSQASFSGVIEEMPPPTSVGGKSNPHQVFALRISSHSPVNQEQGNRQPAIGRQSWTTRIIF